jgi:hypothetical protein
VRERAERDRRGERREREREKQKRERERTREEREREKEDRERENDIREGERDRTWTRDIRSEMERAQRVMRHNTKTTFFSHRVTGDPCHHPTCTLFTWTGGQPVRQH